MAERQTRRSQKPLGATPCGFESHLRHRTRIGQIDRSWGGQLLVVRQGTRGVKVGVKSVFGIPPETPRR